jgi:hypothetical protein
MVQGSVAQRQSIAPTRRGLGFQNGTRFCSSKAEHRPYKARVGISKFPGTTKSLALAFSNAQSPVVQLAGRLTLDQQIEVRILAGELGQHGRRRGEYDWPTSARTMASRRAYLGKRNGVTRFHRERSSHDSAYAGSREAIGPPVPWCVSFSMGVKNG